MSLISHYARGFDINEIKAILDLDDDKMESGLNHIFSVLNVQRKDVAGDQIATTIAFLNQCIALDTQ